jgi:sarcosine oxidase
VRVTVIGAGVFGASTARALARRGNDVTLVEQYVPGTVRSASGGDTRLLRAAHGEATWYAASALRAREAWLELERRTGTRLWEPVGVAWFAHRADGFEAASRAVLAELGVEHVWFAPEEARRLYPSLGVDDLEGVLFEPQAGVLHARTATHLLAEDAVAAGVKLVTRRAVRPASPTPTRSCGRAEHGSPGSFPTRSSSPSLGATSSSSAVTGRGAGHRDSATTTRRSMVTATSVGSA